jgi:O-antigen/teichoic acid export membrane protein
VDPAAKTRRDLKGKSLAALWWSGAQNVAGEALRVAIFLALARLLSPEIFGLMALVWVYLALANVLVEPGLGRALIQREDLEPEHLDTVFWVQLALSGVVCAAGILAADAICGFLGHPELAPVFKALAFVTPLGALNSVHVAQFERAFQGKRAAAAQLASSVIGGVIGIAMALAGYGIWSLVAQQLSGACLGVAINWTVSSWRPGMRLSARALRQIFGFSSGLFGLTLVNVLRKQGDRFLVGFFLGAPALGLYATSHRLIDLLVEVSIRPVSRLGFPLFSRLQTDRNGLKDAYCRVIQGTSAAAFPAFAGMFALAPEIVSATLGPRWQEVATLLRILACLGLVQAIILVDSALLVSQGATFLRLRLNALLGIAVFLLGVAFVQQGLEALCIAIVVCFYCFLPIELRQVNRIIGIGWRRHVENLWPASASALLMLAVVLGAKSAWMSGWGSLSTIGAGIALGALVYCLALFSINPGMRRLARDFLVAHPLRAR